MPSPIIPSHRVEFQYIGATRPHKFHLYVDAVASGDPSGFDFLINGGGSTGATAAINSAFPLWRAIWPATISIANVLLQRSLLGAWLDVAAFANANTGTNANPFQPAQQTSLTFRTSGVRQLAKFIFLETPQPYLGRITIIASLPASVGAFVTDILDLTAGHQGSWARTRGGNFHTSFLSSVYDSNNRVRRDGGYA